MLAFFVIWAPTLFGLIFLVAAGILYAKVRTLALAFFFFGALATTLAPWAFDFVVGTEFGASSVRPLVMVLAFAVEVLGFLFYALSVPRRTRES